MNAFSLELANQFLGALERFREDGRVRAVVVRGSGKIFSAGGDVREMREDVRRGDRAAYFGAPLGAFHRMVLALVELPKPVIAAVHGAVAGIALNMVLGCDFAIAREGTRFTEAFVRLGLSPDGGGTFFLPRRVGHARACELTMLPGEIDARTALEWGLINRVVSAEDFEGVVRETAARFAAGPSSAIARTKALLNRTRVPALEEQMEAERRAQIQNAPSDDFEEGLAAFLEKRPPRFTGR